MTNRRSLLSSGALALLGAALLRPEVPDSGFEIEERARRLASGASAREVGLRYLQIHPHEANVAVLVGAIGARASGAQIERQIQEDFANGRTTRVGGWVLALTECRICALCALLT